MASMILGVAGAAVPGLGPVISAIGGTIGGIIDSKLGLFGRPEPIRAPDVQLALASEGTAGTLVLGKRVRIPLHPIFATPLVRRREASRVNKRMTAEVETLYANLATIAASDYVGAFEQILAEGKRIWIGDPALNLDSTVRATPTAGVTLSYYAYLTLGATQWVVQFTLNNTQDGSGNPQTGSPDLSVYDVGGTCGLLLDGVTINGAGSLVDPDDYWEVLESRIVDAAGNSRLKLRAFLPTTGSPPLFSWSAKFTGANANVGTTVGIRGRLVRTDPRAFPRSGGGVARFVDAKSVLMQTYHGTPATAKPARVEIIDVADMCLSGFGNRVPQLEAIVEALDDDGGVYTGVDARLLAGALTVLFERWAGLAVGTVSMSGLSGATELSGVVINTPFAPADALIRIALTHGLVWQEGTGGDFRGFARLILDANRDTITVAADDLNTRQPDQDWSEEDIERTRIDDAERPRSVEVTFQDYENALQQGVEKAPFEGIGGGEPVTLDLRGVTMTRAEASAIARTVGRKAWNRIEKVRLVLPWTYYQVQEDDVLEVTDRSGGEHTIVVDQIHETDETIEIEGFSVPEAPGDETSGATTGLGGDRLGETGEDPRAIGTLPLVPHVVETRPLADDHASRIGVYVGAAVAAPATSFEPVTVLMRRTDQDWVSVGVLTSPATSGIVPTALASGTTSGYDTTNTLSVVLHSGALAGTTEALCDLGVNLAAVGSEVLGFRVATETADQAFDLTTLSRGRCDTAAAVGTHADDEVFLLLDEAVAFVPLAVEDIGTDIEFAFVPPGLAVDDAQTITHTVTGLCAKPLTPTSVTITAASNKLTVTWDYRTLRSARFRVPTTEPVESGETVRVQLWNSTVAGISGDAVYEMDYPAAAGSLVIHDPHTRGITGAGGGNVACRLAVRGSTVGVSSTVSDDVAATFTAVGVTDHGALTGLSDADHVAGSINFTATDRVLGRSTSGSGAGEEIACTSTGRLIIAKSSLAAVRAALSVYKHWETFVYPPSWWASVHTGTGNSYQQDHTSASWLYATGLGGLFALETGAGTASTDSAARYQGNAGAMYLVDGGEWVFRVACNRSTSLLCRFGLRAEAPAAGHTDVTNGVYFEADTAAGSNWYGCTAAAGTRTKTSTGYALSNTSQTFQLFRIKFVNGTTGVTFSHFDTGTNAWVDDLTINTNLPTAGANRGARLWAMIAYNGATSAKLVFDDLAYDPINGASGAVPILG
jgi:hypothetical protein